MTPDDELPAHPRFGIADLCEALLAEQTRVLAETLGLPESEVAERALTAMNRQARHILETTHHTIEATMETPSADQI